MAIGNHMGIDNLMGILRYHMGIHVAYPIMRILTMVNSWVNINQWRLISMGYHMITHH